MLIKALLAMSLAALQACNSERPLGVRSAVVAGSAHCIELTDDGAVWSWGANHRGQLGVATDALASEVPSRVQGLPKVAQVGAGNAYGVALAGDGRVFAFGDNRHGQLGRTQPSFTSVPHPVPLSSPIVAIAVGGAHVLAMTASGDVWGWGSNQSRQLGLASPGVVWEPTPLSGVEEGRAIAADGPLSAIVSLKGQLNIFGADQISQHCCWPTAARVAIEAGSTVIVIDGGGDILTRVQHGVPSGRRECLADRDRRRRQGHVVEAHR